MALMVTPGLVDGVSFVAASAGTGAFVFSTARASFLTPAQAVANGKLFDQEKVAYQAQDSLINPSQREWGYGTYTASTQTVSRDLILGGVSGGVGSIGTPVSFAVAPVVSLVALAENSFVPKVFADQTFRISVSGNDATGDGSVAHPFATPQAAWNYATIFDYQNQYGFTIQFLGGSFVGANMGLSAGPVFKNNIGGHINIFGDTTTPTNVVWDSQVASSTFVMDLADNFQTLHFGGFQINGGFNAIEIYNGQLNVDYPIAFGGTSLTDGAVFYMQGGELRLNGVTITFRPELVAARFLFELLGLGVGGPPGVTMISNTFNVQAASINFAFNVCQILGGAMSMDQNVFTGGSITGSAVSLQDANWISDNGAFTDMPGSPGGAENTVTLRSFSTSQSGHALWESGGPANTGIVSNGPSFNVIKNVVNGERVIAVNDGGVLYTTPVGNNINVQSGTSYTLATQDTHGIVEMTNSGANSVVVAPDSSGHWEPGATSRVVQAGTGTTTIVAGSGVTVHNVGALSGQWGCCLLYRRAMNEWVQLNGAF